MVEVSYLVAFVAGIVSFLAPCVLPLVPGFLIYLRRYIGPGGCCEEVGYLHREPALRGRFLGRLFCPRRPAQHNPDLGRHDAQVWLSRAGGLIIIFFGPVPDRAHPGQLAEKEYKFRVTGIKSKYLTAFLFGVCICSRVDSCVGAALGAILGLAASQPSLAFTLLLAYSLGLGLPFIITGLFASQALAWIDKYAKAFEYINIIFGILLIILGILIFTQTLGLVANLTMINSILLGS